MSKLDDHMYQMLEENHLDEILEGLANAIRKYSRNYVVEVKDWERIRRMILKTKAVVEDVCP